MADYNKLPVSLRQTPEGSFYEFGVEVEGAWFSFGAVSAPDADARIAAAKAEAEAAKPSRSSK